MELFTPLPILSSKEQSGFRQTKAAKRQLDAVRHV
ncbi:hypothetical protein GGR94_002132 [Sulfitobacter geojensis]|nr:hypothetical protein [Sulfitobacter geojensis]